MELVILARFTRALAKEAAVDRMGLVVVQNVPSLLDAKPIKNNFINKEVLG